MDQDSITRYIEETSPGVDGARVEGYTGGDGPPGAAWGTSASLLPARS